MNKDEITIGLEYLCGLFKREFPSSCFKVEGSIVWYGPFAIAGHTAGNKWVISGEFVDLCDEAYLVAAVRGVGDGLLLGDKNE